MAETRLSIDYGDGNYEPISDPPESEFRKYRKTQLAEAQQINFPFRVQTLENKADEYMYGQPGDYLMRGVEGELYPCAKSVFESSYEAAQ